MTVKVLLVDDHPVVRSGLRAVLALDPELEVVAEVGTADDAVRGAAGADVVLMDLHLGRASDGELLGIGATRRVRAQPQPPVVLVLTTYDDEATVLAALDAGASGYLLKDAPPAELIHGVRRAAHGETVLAPSVAARLAERVRRPRTALSARELEVLSLVARGRSNQQIARELFLSQATVKSHLAHVFTKLGVDSRTGAVSRATELGLLRR